MALSLGWRKCSFSYVAIVAVFSLGLGSLPLMAASSISVQIDPTNAAWVYVYDNTARDYLCEACSLSPANIDVPKDRVGHSFTVWLFKGGHTLMVKSWPNDWVLNDLRDQATGIVGGGAEPIHFHGDVIVRNNVPIADAGGPYGGCVGDWLEFDGSGSQDLDPDDLLEFRWDFESDGAWDTSWSVSPYASHAWSAAFSGWATVEVRDVFEGIYTGDTATATASVSVLQCDLPVYAGDDAYEIAEDSVLDLAAPGVLANDSYPDGGEEVLLVDDVEHGALILGPDGTFQYVPELDFCGTDDFVYALSDVDGDTDQATVTIEVACVNDSPTANDDSDTTPEDTPVTVDVLANDTDPDGDPLTVQSVTQPANGTVTNNVGDVTYIPNPNFCGSDTFTYTISDGRGGSDTAAVMIEVACVDDPVDAVNDGYTTPEDTTLTVSVPGLMANDSF
ncbi:tandem-95 repeat protein, partial [Candidatus Bipolaricaulota bacterium]|nr:tandem-95 repeat protein [Candidatus Bipolaricaulota bacterium]